MTKTKKNVFKRVGDWLKEAKSDMKKIVWPTPKQILKNTGIVVAATLIAALVVSGVDSVLVWILKLLLNL